ncbi:CapA family protein [Paenibacillus sp. sgz500958]|uniref:CapA family protein n=1 Tax=Paenibacillus sp. sgz500958 TaxID=3242475 RepID=UPI0036D42491
MYPPRSKKKRQKKDAGGRRRKVAWGWINAVLILLITAMLAYYFIEQKGSGTAPPSTAENVETPAPDDNPAATPDTTGELSPAEPDASPSADPQGTTNELPEQSDSPGMIDDNSGTEQPDETPSGNTVKLSFGGDVIFAGKVGELLEKQGYDYPYAQLDGLFTRDDLSVINLETSVTERGTSADKQFVFKSSPEALDSMKAAGMDAVNLANNHTLDQGVQGLRDTLEHLDDRGISHVGAGLNEASAYAPQYFERKGITIALLGFTRVVPEASWRAGKNSPGLAAVYDSEAGLKAIAEARTKADIVVVIVHWGIERAHEPNDIQQSLGRSFIDAGADLVIGGHPHVLQGIEPYKGKWIAYSTGNFIFTKSKAPDTWDTAVFQAECNAEGQCSLELKPLHAELGQPVPMKPEDGQKLLDKVESLSGGRISIGSNGKVSGLR